MKRDMLRKLLVILFFVSPLVSYPGCKKQAKCGCGKDVLFTLTNERTNVYWDTGSTISFRTLNDPYSTYNFCNPGISQAMNSLYRAMPTGIVVMYSNQVIRVTGAAIIKSMMLR